MDVIEEELPLESPLTSRWGSISGDVSASSSNSAATALPSCSLNDGKREEATSGGVTVPLLTWPLTSAVALDNAGGSGCGNGGDVAGGGGGDDAVACGGTEARGDGADVVNSSSSAMTRALDSSSEVVSGDAGDEPPRSGATEPGRGLSGRATSLKAWGNATAVGLGNEPPVRSNNAAIVVDEAAFEGTKETDSGSGILDVATAGVTVTSSMELVAGRLGVGTVGTTTLVTALAVDSVERLPLDVVALEFEVGSATLTPFKPSPKHGLGTAEDDTPNGTGAENRDEADAGGTGVLARDETGEDAGEDGADENDVGEEGVGENGLRKTMSRDSGPAFRFDGRCGVGLKASAGRLIPRPVWPDPPATRSISASSTIILCKSNGFQVSSFL